MIHWTGDKPDSEALKEGNLLFWLVLWLTKWNNEGLENSKTHVSSGIILDGVGNSQGER